MPQSAGFRAQQGVRASKTSLTSPDHQLSAPRGSAQIDPRRIPEGPVAHGLSRTSRGGLYKHFHVSDPIASNRARSAGGGGGRGNCRSGSGRGGAAGPGRWHPIVGVAWCLCEGLAPVAARGGRGAQFLSVFFKQLVCVHDRCGAAAQRVMARMQISPANSAAVVFGFVGRVPRR